MEIFNMLIETVGPEIATMATAVVTFLVVAFVKKAQGIARSWNKALILRPLAAVLSFVGVVATAIYTGGEVDQSAVATIVDVLVNTGLAWLGATAIHEVKNG